MGSAYRVVVGKSEELRFRWEDDIKISVKGIRMGLDSSSAAFVNILFLQWFMSSTSAKHKICRLW